MVRAMVLDVRWGFGWTCVVYDAERRPVLTVQCKGGRSGDRDAAKDFYARFGPGVPGSSFLLATPKRCFWWREQALPGAEPDREQDTRTLLGAYLPEGAFTDELVVDAAFSLWFNDVRNGYAKLEGTLLEELPQERVRESKVVRRS